MAFGSIEACGDGYCDVENPFGYFEGWGISQLGGWFKQFVCGKGCEDG